MRPSRAAALALLLCTPLVAGCITRFVRQPVYEDGRTRIFLRGEKRISSVVEKGHTHPVTISAVRMTHILSRLDIRKAVDEGNRRVPAIPTEILYSVAEGVARALDRASPDQEVVVMAVRMHRSFKVFDQDYLTSFVAYVRDEQLFIHLARSDWFVPDRRKSQGLPEPRVGEHPTKLKLYGGTAMTLIDTQSVAVAWRDPIFSRSTRTKILPTGEVRRKTILLESPGGEFTEEEALEERAARYPSGLTPGQLRALADVEEARAAGEITEAEYRLQVQEILDR